MIRIVILFVCALLAIEGERAEAEGERASPPLSIPPRTSFRESLKRGSTPGDAPSHSAGWWTLPVVAVAALAVFGGFSQARKRFLPYRESASIRVIGRTSLSPRQSVYLLRVGDRVLILGSGSQGPPTSLGEVTDPAEVARLDPRRPDRPAPTPVAGVSPSLRPATGFDRRIGEDDE